MKKPHLQPEVCSVGSINETRKVRELTFLAHLAYPVSIRPQLSWALLFHLHRLAYPQRAASEHARV